MKCKTAYDVVVWGIINFSTQAWRITRSGAQQNVVSNIGVYDLARLAK